MAQGGWLNTLGERWVRRPSAGKTAGLPVLARVFTPVERPVPAGDKLYFTSDLLASIGAWGVKLRYAAPTSYQMPLSISPDGGLCFMGGYFVNGSSSLAFPIKLREDGSIDRQTKIGGYTLALTKGAVIEGDSGVFYCQIVNAVSGGFTTAINIIDESMVTMLSSAAQSISVGALTDAVRDTVSDGLVHVSWLNSTTPYCVLTKLNADGTWAFRNTLTQGSAVWSAVALNAAGDIFCFGSTNGGFTGTLIAKYNYLGTLQWVRRFVTGHLPTTADKRGVGGFVMANDDYIVAAKTLPSGRYGICFARFTAAGAISWQNELAHGTGHHIFIDAAHDGSGRIMVAFVAAVTEYLTVMCVLSDGSIEWQYTLTLGATGKIANVTLRADADWLFIGMPTERIILRVPVTGGFSGSFVSQDGATVINVATASFSLAASAYTTANNTNHTTSLINTGSTSAYAVDLTPGLLAMLDPMPFTATGYPTQRRGVTSGFPASVGSTQAGTLLAMGRDKADAQVSASFNAMTRVNGVQAVFIGTFCSPPLNGPQWVGEGGDAALYLAELVSNSTLDFTVGSPEIYVWRPSTGQRVGTLHQARDARIGVPATTSEAVSVVRFSPLPVYAQDQDIIVVELWGQVSGPALSAAYTGSVFYAGATESTTDNAAVTDFAAFLQFSGGNGFVLGSAATEQVTALAVHNEGNAPIDVEINEYSVESDPHWADVAIAMHMDGTSGTTTFTDLKGHTFFAEAGAPVLSNTTMESGTASAYFDGTAALRCNQTLSLGTQDFTFEAWVNFSSDGYFSSADIFSFYNVALGDNAFVRMSAEGFLFSDYRRLAFNVGTGTVAYGPTQINLNMWHHIAFVRSGDDFYLFLNGDIEATFTSVGWWGAPAHSFGTICLGLGLGPYHNDGGGPLPTPTLDGYLDEVRVTIGVARYTSAFTPSPRFITVDESTTRDVLGYSISLTPLGVVEAGSATGEGTAYANAETFNEEAVGAAAATDVVTGGLYFASKVKEQAPAGAVIDCAGPVRVAITNAASADAVASATMLLACSTTEVITAIATQDFKLTLFASSLNEAAAGALPSAQHAMVTGIVQAAAADTEQGGAVQMFVSAAAEAAAFDFGTGLVVIGVFADAVGRAQDVVSRDGFVDVSFVAEAIARDLIDVFGNIALPAESLAVITHLAETYCRMESASIHIMRADSSLFVLTTEEGAVKDDR